MIIYQHILKCVLFLLCFSSYQSRTRPKWLKCPFNCNYQGSCLRNHTCDCYAGYTGPDCSFRACAYGTSWSAKPFALGKAHRPLECSGNGLCIRNKGRCKCFDGYIGNACERTTCGDDYCHGRGTCLTSGNLYTLFTTNRSSDANYTNWDHMSTTSCVCQAGYSGASCEMKLCPLGDDPMTITTGYISFNITTYALWGVMSGGAFLLSMIGKSVSFPADASLYNSSACTSQLSSLLHADLSCIRSDIINESGGATYTITIYSLSSAFTLTNNIYRYDASYPLSSLKITCIEQYNTIGSQGLQCDIHELTATNATLPEYTPCSNRGRCDMITGTCMCYPSYTGSSCNLYQTNTTSSSLSSDDDNLLTIIASETNFTASILHLISYTPGSSNFNYLTCDDVYGEILRIDGEGNVVMHRGGLVLDGGYGQTIHYGGLAVSNGMTITSSDMIVDGDMVIQGGIYTSSSALGFHALAGVSIMSDGMRITGGLTILSGGCTLQQGLDISSGGMMIAGSKAIITGGMSIAAAGIYMQRQGISINDGGLIITGGITATGSTSYLMVSGGVSINDGGLHTTGSMTIQGGGVIIQGAGLTIMNDGLAMEGASGGITIGSLMASSGMTATVSGLIVEDGGMMIYDGASIALDMDTKTSDITIISGGLLSVGGMTITGPITLQQGVTITAGSLYVDSGDITLRGGLIVAGGSVTTNTLVVESGATIHRGAAILGDGLTVGRAGVRIDGYMTINGGYHVTDGVTITNIGSTIAGYVGLDSGMMLHDHSAMYIMNGGMQVTDGMTISGGMNIYDGLTIQDALGCMINTGGMTITGNGVNLASNLIIYDDAGIITSGISGPGGGVWDISSGMTVIGDNIAPLGYMTAPASYMRVLGGGVTIGTAGLATSSRVKIHDLGVSAQGMTVFSPSSSSIRDGVSINSIGLNIGAGMSVEGGLNIIAGGMTITNQAAIIDDMMLSNADMIIVAGGVSIQTQGLTVTSNMIVDGGQGLVIDGGMTAINAILQVTGGMTVDQIMTISGNAQVNAASASMIVSQGMTIVNTANMISAQGLTVYSGGMITGGSVTVSSGAMSIAGGMTVKGAMSVSANGLTVNAGGVMISGGMSINTLGATSSTISGLAVMAGRGYITGSIVVSNSDSVYITGGMTITSTGIDSAAGMAVDSIYAYNSVSIASGGLDIKSYGQGLSVLSNGLQIQGAGGDLTVYGHSVWYNSYSSSDERLKHDIHRIDGALDKIQRLRGVYYSWKDDPYHHRMIGMIAQEVKEVVPELISTSHDDEDDDGVLEVRYHGVIPLLIEGLQQLQQHHIMNVSSSSAANDVDMNEEEEEMFDEMDMNRVQIAAMQSMIIDQLQTVS